MIINFYDYINEGKEPTLISKKPYGYWTKRTLQEEADKYETRREFFKKSNSACSIARKLKLIDELFKNHPNYGYIDREEWRENSYVIYAYEIEEFNSAYIGLTNNMKRRDKEHLFSEKEKMSLFCKENDIPYPKYKILEENLTSIEAQRQERYWESFYKDNGWEMFNISKTGSLGAATKWTKNSLQKEADKYETREDFRKNNSGAYTTSRRLKLLDKLFKNHLNNGYSEKQKADWTEEKLQEESDKYETIKDFRENSSGAYYAAKSKKILDRLFKNHYNKGNKDLKWTKDTLQEEADKYETIKDFRKHNYNSYSASAKYNLLDELFKNHPNKGYKNSKWTKTALQEEADKYKTREEFRKKSNSAYSTAVTQKILDKLFKNHPNKGFLMMQRQRKK